MPMIVVLSIAFAGAMLQPAPAPAPRTALAAKPQEAALKEEAARRAREDHWARMIWGQE